MIRKPFIACILVFLSGILVPYIASVLRNWMVDLLQDIFGMSSVVNLFILVLHTSSLIVFPIIIYLFLRDIKYAKQYAILNIVLLIVAFIHGAFGSSASLFYLGIFSSSMSHVLLLLIRSVLEIAMLVFAILVASKMNNRFAKMFIIFAVVWSFGFSFYDELTIMIDFLNIDIRIASIIYSIITIPTKPFILYLGFKELGEI